MSEALGPAGASRRERTYEMKAAISAAMMKRLASRLRFSLAMVASGVQRGGQKYHGGLHCDKPPWEE